MDLVKMKEKDFVDSRDPIASHQTPTVTHQSSVMRKTVMGDIRFYDAHSSMNS
jgi:hypothetical protein